MNRNIIFVLIIVIGFIISSKSESQDLGVRKAGDFVEALINNSEDLEKYVLPEELELSKRLGISYEGVQNKFLIGYDLDDEIRVGLISKKFQYKYDVKILENGDNVLVFSVPEKNYEKKYYFKNGLWISQVSYFIQGWKKTESEHFIFVTSETDLINDYAVNKMEEFLLRECELLKIDERKLRENKIYYVLCKNQDEIEKVTGYKSLGMCDLAFDYVISTFPCHYHELSHLIMNFKLQNISLYTNPFLQEGFAVAMGGRGGREPGIIHNVGYFLAKSGFADYKDFLNRQKFFSEDASIGYPICGVYNLFLIKEIGIEKYLELYKKYSTDKNKINESEISVKNLPDESEWKNFIDSEYKVQGINLDDKSEPGNIVLKNDEIMMSDIGDYYRIGVKDTVLLKENNPPENYISNKFREIFPNSKYAGEKYLIIAGEKEILIYNLYTNNLLADYVPSFSISPVEIKRSGEYYYFNVKKSIFDSGIKIKD